MGDVRKDNNIGLLLKKLLKEKSLSMRKLSVQTGIDTATISRIINGKRNATPEHLRKFSDCLGIPIAELFKAAGFPIEEQSKQNSDIYMTVDSIQNILESSNLIDKGFTIEDVKKQLANYEQYVQTNEGKETIINNFEEKMQKVGSIGPFINQLRSMYEKFRLKKGTTREILLIGSALLYFIIPVDIIPDYIFPLGYIDDAIAVQIIISLLERGL
ncbi:MAG: helix-turn-helix domain-containing protein [Bacillota bacterium]|nr:helix-turn-helix domain-containing protein [Bacillota bacterium]